MPVLSFVMDNIKFSELEYKRVEEGFLERFYEELNKDFDNAQDAKAVIAVIRKENDELAKAFSGADLSAIRFYLNTTDEYYRNEYMWWQGITHKAQDYSVELGKRILACSYTTELVDEFGTLYLPLLRNQVLLHHPELKELKMEETQLVQEYESLVSSLKFNFPDKVVGKWGSGSYRSNPDRAYRMQAAKEISNVVTTNKGKLEELYVKLWENRKLQSERLGFSDKVDYFYILRNRVGFSKKEIQQFYNLVKKYILPIRNEEYDKQGKRNDLDVLKLWDEGFYFKSGYELLEKDAAKTLEKTGKMYDDISEETSTFFKYMMEYEYLEYKNKPEKAQIGFATILSGNLSPYIFSILEGANFDVTVLTHEFGHAFQFSQVPKDRLRMLTASLAEVAEIHSSSMELITMPYMKLFYGEDDYKYNYGVVRRGLDMIIDNSNADKFLELTYSLDTFDVNKAHQIYRELYPEAKPVVDISELESFEKGYHWLFNGHFYSSPFYIVDYALAQVVSFQLWFEYLENPKQGWEKYLMLCRNTGSNTFEELVESAGLISPFKEEAFIKISDGLKKWFGDFDRSLRGKSF